MDINVDMGESFGRWSLGDDAHVMPWITSANVACGFHAGDPATMRASVRLAGEHGVGVGAHVGLPDLLGFGRRRMDVSAAEVRDYTAYQLGALAAIAASEGARVAHVKPHGALYVLCSNSEEHASAVAQAIAGYDAGVPLLLLSVRLDRVAQRAVRLAREGRIDASDGSDLRVDAETVCLHGDAPNAAAVARAVRAALERAGVRVAALA